MWQKAELLSRKTDAAIDLASAEHLVSAIRGWQKKGYVMEDACVLALFQYAATDPSDGTADPTPRLPVAAGSRTGGRPLDQGNDFRPGVSHAVGDGRSPASAVAVRSRSGTVSGHAPDRPLICAQEPKY